MGTRRIRTVVIVRCPLCGCWIVGNDYGAHVGDVHLEGPEPAWKSLPESLGLEDEPVAPEAAHACPGGHGPYCHVDGQGGQRLTPATAGALLNELGRRWSEGQEASLGFEIYE